MQRQHKLEGTPLVSWSFADSPHKERVDPMFCQTIQLLEPGGSCRLDLVWVGWQYHAKRLAAPPANVTMKVEPYFGGHFKFGEWLPLHVTLANDGPALRVEVRADTTEAGSQTTFVVPVELPTGARKRITLYVQPPSFAKAVRVRLIDGARELESQSLQVTVERNVNYVVGVIAPRSEPFAVLNGLTLNSAQAAQGIELKWTGSQQPRPVRVIPMRCPTYRIGPMGCARWMRW